MDNTTQWIHKDAQDTHTFEPDKDITEYTYDGDGGRVMRKGLSPQGTVPLTTIYIGSSYEITIDNTTGEVIEYKKQIFMGSQRTCEVVHEEDEIHAYFVHADHIGSSNVLTNESGQRASLFEYKPFGSLAYAAEDNSYDTDKRFTGKTYDNSSGLHYYGARYYDSEIGRFITADPTIQHPYDPQDFNRYAYCRNNPVKYVDPSGYGWLSWLGKIIGGIAGAIAGYFGGPAAGMAVFSAISAGFSAMDSGANIWQAMGVATVAGVAGYAGGALGAAYGGAIKAGTWGTSFLSGMFAGAAGGATGALLTGENAGMGALSGATSGATMGAFGGLGGVGKYIGPMFGSPLAGVAGAAVSGGNLGEGAISGVAGWYGFALSSALIAANPSKQAVAKVEKDFTDIIRPIRSVESNSRRNAVEYTVNYHQYIASARERHSAKEALLVEYATKNPPYSDEFTREAKRWEWVVYGITRFIYNLKMPPGYQGPDVGPVPPNHRDWFGIREPRMEDHVI